MAKKLKIFLALLTTVFVLIFIFKKLNPPHSVGDIVDSLNNVNVYYNGSTSNVLDRNTVDGYNIGLKYQCVEFVKRYYFEYYKHKMPNSYGHAKDFFDLALNDGEINNQRALFQHSNPSVSKPKIGDLIVMNATFTNSYGHVAIISNVAEESLEIIQQNPGYYGNSRATFRLENINGKWHVENNRVLGWLRKES